MNENSEKSQSTKCLKPNEMHYGCTTAWFSDQIKDKSLNTDNDRWKKIYN